MMAVDFLLHPVGQPFDEIAAAQRIDRLRDAALVRDDLLRTQRDLGAELGGDLEGFVVGAGEDRLRTAQHRRHGLDRDARDVVVGLHAGKRGAAADDAEAEHQRLRVGDPIAFLQQLAQSRRPARNLATSSKKSMCT